MPVKKTKHIKPVASEHGGACPTCGHCKCCEKAAKPAITFPICTRPHYPMRPFVDWTYRPYEYPVWFGTSTTSSLTVTSNDTTKWINA